MQCSLATGGVVHVLDLVVLFIVALVLFIVVHVVVLYSRLSYTVTRATHSSSARRGMHVADDLTQVLMYPGTARHACTQVLRAPHAYVARAGRIVRRE
eukprot:COSAG02_NODE_1203_length_13900_cov_11.040287_4_plen_98_part_00